MSKQSVRDIIMQQEQELDAVASGRGDASGRSGPLSQVVSVPGLAMAPETRDVVPEEVLRAHLRVLREPLQHNAVWLPMNGVGGELMAIVWVNATGKLFGLNSTS